MGERKGQNFYYPPDFDPKKHGNLNRYHGVHALRERAAKISQGILIIRFEMPFNVWCEGCTRHIGMGVRYNAEKKKVGNYYTTPIYEFKMRCHLCENYFHIRTDPKNFDYELVSGLKRQEKRWQPGDFDGVEHTGKEIAKKIASDPMFKLEHGEEDKKKASFDEPRMYQLEAIQDRMKDDFAANQALRRNFRGRKKELNAQGITDAKLLSKFSLGSMPLLGETEADKEMASLLSRYKEASSSEERKDNARKRIHSRPIMASSSSTAKSVKSSPSIGVKVKASSSRTTVGANDAQKLPVTSAKSADSAGNFRTNLLEMKEKAKVESRNLPSFSMSPSSSALRREEDIPSSSSSSTSSPIVIVTAAKKRDVSSSKTEPKSEPLSPSPATSPISSEMPQSLLSAIGKQQRSPNETKTDAKTDSIVIKSEDPSPTTPKLSVMDVDSLIRAKEKTLVNGLLALGENYQSDDSDTWSD